MPKARNKSRRRLSKTELLLLLIAVIFLGYAFLHLQDWYSHTQGTATPPDNSRTVTDSPVKPDEKPVPPGITYNVPADQPKILRIVSIGLEGLIQKVGENRQHEIGTPTNVNYAGWFTGSAKPGETGLSIIDGHVSGRYSTALFAKLAKLQKGAFVTIQFGDNSLRSFEVIDKRELPKNQASQFLLQKRADVNAQLNLITCGGAFDKNSHQYNNRVVVVTRRVY